MPHGPITLLAHIVCLEILVFQAQVAHSFVVVFAFLFLQSYLFAIWFCVSLM